MHTNGNHNNDSLPSLDERDALTSRVIPVMKLSNASNPLTRPLDRNESISPSERAANRFAIKGNAVVTGGAGALGLQSARALLEHGASAVALLDLPSTFKSSMSSIDILKSSFPDCCVEIFTLDVTNELMVTETISRVAHVFGGIDILCCFAGIVNCAASISVPASMFSKVLDVNLLGSFLCAQAVAKCMIEQGRGGSILFTASISANHTNFPQPQAAYNVSKAAVKHLATNLAVEWAIHGIRVNSISPGYMDTVLNAGNNLEAIRNVWADNNPMGRMGDVEEITAPVIMLCSQQAGRYITGVDILIDGGAMCL